MLRVEGLEVRYGAIRAVRGIDLEVADGEVVALLGANGAGKSSTLLAIAGAVRVTAGHVRIDGEETTNRPPEWIVRRGVAMVPETRDVFPDLTVEENLRLGAWLHRRDRAGVARDRARMLELFPRPAERLDQPAGTISGGEQQMLVIARAMMARPRLLLLDEPSLGLAPTIVGQIFAMIAALARTGLAILLVEQNVSRALALARRAYVMRLGRVAAGPAAELAAASDLEEHYLGVGG